ncbi:hypothetical protein N7507_008391 [Penicillium longicatenatum]|nr:hypothetical protein N7507_008391 [Penicillium longicatenatum]
MPQYNGTVVAILGHNSRQEQEMIYTAWYQTDTDPQLIPRMEAQNKRINGGHHPPPPSEL